MSKVGIGKLLVRADASKRIGAGHVLRCLAIAERWLDQGGEVRFCTFELPDYFYKRLDLMSVKIDPIHGKVGTEADARQLIRFASETKTRAVILDGYHFDEQYQNVVVENLSCPSMLIDDFGNLDSYQTDFILNQNLGAKETLYEKRSSETELLLGTKFALLRKEFRNIVPRPLSSEIKNVLVTLGGSDPENRTETVLDGLMMLEHFEVNVRVLAGSLNPKHELLKQRADRRRGIEILSSVDNMVAQYQWADFVIAAGGSTNWELCLFGLPRLLIEIASNQQEVCFQLRELGIAKVIFQPELTAFAVRDAFSSAAQDREWLENASQRARQLVDALGADRCVRKLLKAGRG